MDPNLMHQLALLAAQPNFILAAWASLNQQQQQSNSLVNLLTPNLLSGGLPMTPPSTSSSSNVDTSPEAETPSGDRKRKRIRTTYSPSQTERLEAAFLQNNHLNAESRKQIAEQTGLDVLQVNKWFQNRRSKQRKQSLPKNEVATVAEPVSKEDPKSGEDERKEDADEQDEPPEKKP
ncbi:hypothetical protein QR680_013480 [Steinernema hermaphroditum]|uniref:Homeobox domain-containing protein n=1 Tax=Steinernema hermaphroditum TaxID=289476 RepID=A0AA39M2C6_9BILA|nr:hypothetical protein QR680_013480 [Steinernema hermaphroditum]